MSDGGEVCPQCGYAMGGEVEDFDSFEPDEEPVDEDQRRREFARALSFRNRR